MARLFLTNIDLNTNELQNAVVQNLSSAPLSGNKEGRIYYDVTNKALYLYTDGQWKPLASGGAAASSIELTGDVTGTANVDPATGKLTVETTVDSSFVTLTGTQTLTNKTLQGRTYLKSGGGAGGTGIYLDVDNNGNLSVNSNWNVGISAGNDLTLSTNNGNIVLNPDGSAYIGGTDASQRIATIYDLTNATLNIQGTDNQITVSDVAGTSTISLPSYIDIPNGEMHLAKTEYWLDGNQYGVVASNPYSNTFSISSVNYPLQLESHNGDIQLLPNSGVINATNAEIHTQKTEYWYDGSNLGAVIAHPYDGSLTVASTGWLHLESHNGNIRIDADNGRTVFNNNIQITSDGYVYANNSNLTLGSDNGNVNIEGTLYTDSIRAYGSDTLYINADAIVLDNNVQIGGSGTNGMFWVKDSNSSNAFYVDSSANEAGFSGDVTIGGNLNVAGTLNAVNRTEINVEDNTIVLNTTVTGAPTEDAGLIVNRGTANDTAIIWSEANDQWTLTNDGSHYYAIARKYVEVIGDASNTSFDVVHNLGTRDITVMVRENNAEYNVVETDVLMKDANTVTIGFTDAPTANAYKVIIVG